MAIEFRCHGCGKMLRVADEHAGKQARCPECGYVFTVAADTAPQQERPLAGPAGLSPSAKEVGDAWYMKTPEGQIYGSVGRRELDTWLAEGRITDDCQLRQGEFGAWQAAADVYTVLAAAPSPSAAPPSASYGGYGGGRQGYAPYGRTHYPSHSAHLAPHRGTTVLVLAILGWAFCVLFSIIALVMANDDLNRMRTGLMDPSGMAITQAGQIIAIIHVALSALAVLFFVGFCICGAAAG